MASGGNFPPNSHNCRPGNSSLNRNSIVDNDCENDNPGPPWLLTANNLSLHTSAAENRLSKKQRNKTNPRVFPITDTSSVSPESSPQAVGGAKSSQKPIKLSIFPKKETEAGDHARFRKPPVDLDEDVSDVGETGAEAPRELRFVTNQKRQKRNTQNGTIVKKSPENFQISNNKQDNTNKLPDTSVLVERLMHLRDCIKQVTSIMQNLEKTDGPVTRGQLENLDQMLGQLKNEEHENLECLQRLLVFQEGAGATNIPQNNKPEDSSSCSGADIKETNPPIIQSEDSNDEEDPEEAEKQKQLLQKMVTSQKKLASLKEQQSALLTMQRKAENRLAEVKAFHEHLLQTGLSTDDGDWPTRNSPSQIPTSQPPAMLGNGVVTHDVEPTPALFNGILNWENDLEIHHQNEAYSKTANSSTPSAIIKKDTRKGSSGSCKNRSSGVSENFLQVLQELGISDDSEDDEEIGVLDENSEVLTDQHRKKLENKLRELQEKKHQMDSLLAELSSLQVNPPPKELLDTQSTKPLINGHVEASSSASRSVSYGLQDAQCILESSNAIEKMKQLEELKKKLTQLKVLTDNLEFGNLNIDNTANANSTTTGGATGGVDPENGQWSGRNPRNKKDKMPSGGSTLKSDNLRRDHTSPGFPARRHYEAEGRANEDGDSGVPTAQPPSLASAAALAANGAIGAAKGSSSLPLASISAAQEQTLLEEHAEIEAKVSKLLATKNKLQQLKGLLGAVHQYRQTGEPLPNEVHQFLTGLQSSFGGGAERGNRLSDSNASLPATGEAGEDNITASASHQQPADIDRLNEVEEQLMRQQRELEHLTEERKRLLSMQDHLVTLQHQQQKQYSTLKNNEQRSSGEGGSLGRREQRTNQISSALSNLLVAGVPNETNRGHSGRRDNLNRQEQSARSSLSDNQTTSAKDLKNSSGKTPNLLNVSRNQTNKKYEQQQQQHSQERVSEQSLADLNDELNHSLALRDELQHQKAVLQELLLQEQSKQIGFSPNQDMHSQSGSSEKSEMVEGGSSVLAPDTTAAATWGGSSTQDNLDDEVEEELLESLEEQDEDEEGSGNELKSSEGRLQTLLQPCVDQHQVMPDMENYQRRRNNRTSRVHGYRRGLLNQWRKNFQTTSHKNETQQPCYQQPRQENRQAEDTASSSQATDLQAVNASSEIHWRQFTKHIQQQLEQTNVLCQSVLKDQQALGNMMFAFPQPQQTPLTPAMGAAGNPDILRYYAHLQQQQQLLLSLSHCYHMLYLQQIEIRTLQGYLQQSPESDIPRTSPIINNNNMNNNNNNAHPLNGLDEFSCRPWCMAPSWLTAPQPPSIPVASVPPIPLQSPFMYPPTATAAPFCFNPVLPSAPQFPNNTLGIITPNTAQDERGAAETLNNQVPPGTRANNFLDNFRSYSRQNLLSTAPTTTTTSSKSNEPPSAAPPVRPPYSFSGEMPTTIAGSQRSRDAPVFPPFAGPYSLPSMSGRRSSTPNASPLTCNSGGVRPRIKRPNLNQEQGSGVHRTSGCLNLLSLYDPSRQSPVSENSPTPKTDMFNEVAQTPRRLGDSEVGTPEPNAPPIHIDNLRDSIYMEVTSLITNYEQQPDLLADLLKQIQNLAETPQTNNATNTSTPAKGLSSSYELLQLRPTCTGARRKQMDIRSKNHSPHNDFARSGGARLNGDAQLKSSSIILDSSQRQDTESPAIRLGEQAMESPIEESSSSSNSWPKISPATTGAVQKKYTRHFASSTSAQASFIPPQETPIEESGQLVKQTVLSLVPFLQGHLSEECTPHLQAQLCNHILNALQNLPVHQPLLRFFRSQLLQALQQMLAKYSGRRVRECEEDMLMEITEVVMKEMTIQKIMQKKKEDTQRRGDWSSICVNRGSSTNIGPSATDFDSPQSNESRFHGSEGFSESELTTLEVKTSLENRQQDWAVETTFGKEESHLTQSSEMNSDYNMPKSALDLQPDRLDVRAAPDGLAAAPIPLMAQASSHLGLVHPLSPRLLEEESGYDCDAEGETEPEVEAETDDTKDLAEADQSAGQLGAMGASTEMRLPQPCLRERNGGMASSSSSNSHPREEREEHHLANGDLSEMEDLGVAGAEALPQGQTSAAEGEGEELSLDDIPTKLETLTSDEVRRQMTEEQASNQMMHELLSNGTLNGEGKDGGKDAN